MITYEILSYHHPLSKRLTEVRQSLSMEASGALTTVAVDDSMDGTLPKQTAGQNIMPPKTYLDYPEMK
jgi:hypothetical protein